METQKIYMGGGSDANRTDIAALLTSALNSKGLDANSLLPMLCNGGGFGGFGGGMNWLIGLIAVAAIFGWNGNGNGGLFGGRGGDNSATDLIMSTLNRNGLDITQLAQTLNCSVGQINNAINAISGQICNLSAQTGQNSLQIINAIQSGNASLASQLASCCCDLKTSIERQGYENRLSTMEQTNFIGGKIDAQTTLINDKFCQLEMRDLRDKLDTERDKSAALALQLSQEHQNAYIAQVMAQATAPLVAGQNDLSKRLAEIECKQPQTVNVPYSPIVGVPTCVAAQYGLGLGLPNGFFGNGFFG